MKSEEVSSQTPSDSRELPMMSANELLIKGKEILRNGVTSLDLAIETLADAVQKK